MKRVKIQVLTTLLLWLVFLLFSKTSVNAESILSPEFSDEFNSLVLDSKWSWMREDPTHWNLTENPGSIRIYSTPFNWDNPHLPFQNVLLQNTPTSPYEFSTKLTFSPVGAWQSAGLMMYQNEDDRVFLVRQFDPTCPCQTLNFGYVFRGLGSHYRVIPLDLTQTYLKLRVDKDRVISYYSEDGSIWQEVSSLTLPFNLISPKMGIYATAGTETTAPEIPADFDFFRTSVPQQHDYLPSSDYFNDEFDYLTLNPRWEIRTENGLFWTLKDRPGSLRIYSEYGTLTGFLQDGRNIFLQTPPIGDFTMETKVQFSPYQPFHSAGLVVFEDYGTFLSCSKNYNESGEGLITEHEFNHGSYGDEGIRILLPPITYLKMEKVSNIYYCYYSQDGNSWTLLRGWGEFDFVNPKVGIYAVNGRQEYFEPFKIPADFDYFHIAPIDTTPPTIAINSPKDTVSANTVPINVAITDNESGVASYQYFLDGTEIQNTSSTIDMTYRSAGEHTFSITAVDKAGNSGTESSVFTYLPTAGSLEGAVNQMYADGEITRLGNSIYDKLHQAQSYISMGNYGSARQVLNALINQIEAQIDIHITANSGYLLIADINYLLSTFP